nr:hypothetical protein Iba_chr01dCG3090 [Ipomoea batatas]
MEHQTKLGVKGKSTDELGNVGLAVHIQGEPAVECVNQIGTRRTQSCLSLFSTEVIISVFTMVRYNKANEIPMLKVPMQIIQCSTGTNPIYICHISLISLSMERITNVVKTSGALRERLFNDCLQLQKATYHESYCKEMKYRCFGLWSSLGMLNAVSFTVVTVLGISMFTDPGQHRHDVQCGEHVRGGDPTRVREHGDDVAGNTQNSNGSEADCVEHSK